MPTAAKPVSEPALSHLFEPLQQRSVAFRNRLAVSPMCQYSARDGMPDDWHLVHLGSRAVGGAAAVIAEATAIAPEGRISPADTGIWNDAQADAWARIAGFIEAQGAVAGIQLAHAGRKASTHAPWLGRGAVPAQDGGWVPVAPSALAFDAHYAQPRALDRAGIARVIEDFALAARRSLKAGFRLLEVHAAHGYLLHQFLSPLSNRREDDYGGSFQNRVRLVCEVLDAVRHEWPQELPVWVRISATDWADGGWDIEQSVALSRLLAGHGVDLVDVSSGGLVPDVEIPLEPGYQAPFAARIRREAGIATGAVGLITDAQYADALVATGEADMVLLARELLRDPYFPQRAARQLGAEMPVPVQYQRAW
jgi:2,4-dienoyl-CoA reductase-like NADH-dependent reductase (Old Yellow Enzyme family)